MKPAPLLERFRADADPAVIAASFRKAGAVIFDALWTVERIALFRANLAATQPQFFAADPAGPESAQQVGDQRYAAPLPLTTGPLGSAESCLDLILHPAVSDLLDGALGQDWVFEALGVVVAWPGAGDQQIHRDGPQLYGEAGIDAILPPYAITVSIPLQALDARTGSTAIWPGTQFLAGDDPQGLPVVPEAEAGSCLLWNFRTAHRGLANRSDEPRLLLYFTACRRFWVDSINFGPERQRKIIIAPGIIANLPEQHRARFVRAEAPFTHLR